MTRCQRRGSAPRHPICARLGRPLSPCVPSLFTFWPHFLNSRVRPARQTRGVITSDRAGLAGRGGPGAPRARAIDRGIPENGVFEHATSAHPARNDCGVRHGRDGFVCSRLLVLGRWRILERLILVEQQRGPFGHAQRERIDVPAHLPAGGRPELQVDRAQRDGQLRRRRLGQGAHRPGFGNRPVRGLGLADPVRRGFEFQGQAPGALLPRHHRPDHDVVQPVRREQPEADADAHRGHLPGQDHEVE